MDRDNHQRPQNTIGNNGIYDLVEGFSEVCPAIADDGLKPIEFRTFKFGRIGLYRDSPGSMFESAFCGGLNLVLLFRERLRR